MLERSSNAVRDNSREMQQGHVFLARKLEVKSITLFLLRDY